MKKLNVCLKVTTFSLLTLGFTACQVDANKTESKTTLTYRLSQNGCDTGKKTFNDLGSYCASLQDDAANNFCATELRAQLFDKNCQGTKKSTPRATTKTESTERTEVHTQERTEETRQETKSAASEVPEVIEVTAHPDSPLQAVPNENVDQMLSRVKGQLIIDSIEPAFDRPLILISADTVTIKEDLGRCDLAAKKFQTLQKDKPLPFLLIGADPAKTTETDGCFTRLSTLAITGFTAEFTNVLVAGPAHDFIPKVILKVNYK